MNVPIVTVTNTALLFLLLLHDNNSIAAAARPSVVLSKSIMAMIEHSARLSDLAYYATPDGSDLPDDVTSFVVEPDAAIVTSADGYCYVAFRGTTLTWSDWWQNFDPGMADVCLPTVEDGAMSCCSTREGFYEAYDAAYRYELEREVRECAAGCVDKNECVVFTGHSQGGAVAALAGIVMADLNPYVVTFGQPLTVDAPCDLITSERWYRFVNTKFGSVGVSYDPVPFAPGLGADSFGHLMLVSDDDSGVSYIGLDAQDEFGPPNVFGAQSHSMQGDAEHPGYLPRVQNIMSHGSYPVRTSGYAVGSPCTEDKECESDKCAQEVMFDYWRCTADECVSDDECDTNRCDNGLCLPKLGSCMECNEDSDCLGGKCSMLHNVCSGDEGLMDDKCMCTFEWDCISGRCEGYLSRMCEAKLGEGASCNENSDCKSGDCSWFKCTGKDSSVLVN